MTARRVLAVVFELAMLAASLGANGSVVDGVRIVAVVVMAALGAVVVIVAVVFAVALLEQRRPPYPMG
jgi:hypothetical protein